MRIHALNNDNFEERRRVLLRKEANDAYKKNAVYTQATKNPMLKILEGLLSGKTEKELFEKEQPVLNEELNAVTPEMNDGNQSMIESPQKEMTSELMLQSMEAASDQEENVNRIPYEQFDFLDFELLAPPAGRNALNHHKNKSYESMVFEKTYTKAVSSYTYHMQIAQNGFTAEQSLFSYIA